MLTDRLGMARADDVLELLRVHLERTRRLTMSTAGQLRASLNEHSAIAAAIEAEDPVAAREAMNATSPSPARGLRLSQSSSLISFHP